MRIEAPKGSGVWGGCSSSLGDGSAEGAVIFDFGFQHAEFWYILGDIFTVQLLVLHAKRYNLVPFPVIYILFFASK